MTRPIDRRLSALEQSASQMEAHKPSHRIIGDSIAELDAAAAEMIATGKAAPDDRFIYRLIITPANGRESHAAN